MNTVVLALCGERVEGGWKVRRYAYLDDPKPGERPRDANAALGYLNRLEGNDGVTSAWTVGEKPPKELRRFFDVLLLVGDIGAMFSRNIDYRSYPGCPSPVIDDGMEIYRLIKKHGVRPSNKAQLADMKSRAAKKRARHEALKKGKL